MFVSDQLSAETAALILGIMAICALIYYLRTNLSPGGLIVPGALVLTALGSPLSLMTTVIATAGCYGLVLLTMQYTILYGKRLFVVCLITALVIELTAFIALRKAIPEFFPNNTLGYLAPGLITYQFFRQEIGPTLVSTSVVALVGYGIVVALLII